jgi:hypothetical protein
MVRLYPNPEAVVKNASTTLISEVTPEVANARISEHCVCLQSRFYRKQRQAGMRSQSVHHLTNTVHSLISLNATTNLSVCGLRLPLACRVGAALPYRCHVAAASLVRDCRAVVFCGPTMCVFSAGSLCRSPSTHQSCSSLMPTCGPCTAP